MVGEELIQAIKKAVLKGRGGAGFDTAMKWQMVTDAKSDKKFVTCNATEGEPETIKDFYILKNHTDDVVNGMVLAMHTVGANEGIIFIHKEKYKLIKFKIDKEINHLPISIKHPTGGYRCGEETVLLNDIEGKRTEPRNKPPFPTNQGLYSKPTLINNVETLWAVSRISKGEYNNNKFYTVLGNVSNPGVYELTDGISIIELLQKTKNIPSGKTFAQVGGGASGSIVMDTDYSNVITGLGAVTIHKINEVQTMLKTWSKFYECESCGLCVPCREGTHRINELLNSPKPDWDTINQILEALGQTSFCALGRSVYVPFRSIQDNKIVEVINNNLQGE